MYETYWKLAQKPFENAAEPRFYYPAESHQAALLKLRYAIESRRGAALLTGPSGVGKTLLSTMLPSMLSDEFAPLVRVVFPQMSSSELLAYIAERLDGGDPASSTGVHASVRRIERFLSTNGEQGRHAVIVIDEAQVIESPQVFETLRLLLNFENGGEPGLTLLLVGQPALLPRMERMPAWEERLGVKCLLRAFSEPETAAYVEHRLRAAGARRPIIEPEAIPVLHELTHGIPRHINRLCDLALLIGFAEERPSLGGEHFQAVCRELVIVGAE